MTPFEVRAEMLKMAQDYLQTQYDTQVEFLNRSMNLLASHNQVTRQQIEELMPKMYDINEIVAKAGELYSFVREAK